MIWSIAELQNCEAVIVPVNRQSRIHEFAVDVAQEQCWNRWRILHQHKLGRGLQSHEIIKKHNTEIYGFDQVLHETWPNLKSWWVRFKL